MVATGGRARESKPLLQERHTGEATTPVTAKQRPLADQGRGAVETRSCAGHN